MNKKNIFYAALLLMAIGAEAKEIKGKVMADGKGLAGLEDGLFPSYMSITSDNSQAEIEEERRLAYVGITRAKKNTSHNLAPTIPAIPL